MKAFVLFLLIFLPLVLPVIASVVLASGKPEPKRQAHR